MVHGKEERIEKEVKRGTTNTEVLRNVGGEAAGEKKTTREWDTAQE